MYVLYHILIRFSIRIDKYGKALNSLPLVP